MRKKFNIKEGTGIKALTSKALDIFEFKPIYQNIVVEVVKVNNLLDSGLYAPDSIHKEKIREGVVAAIGFGRLLKDGTTIPLVVKVGDRIIFNEYVGTKYEKGGKVYRMIKEDDVWCTIESKSPITLYEREIREDGHGQS